MKQLPKVQQEIVRRAWDKLDETSFGYVPLGEAPDGFHAYAKVACGDEWSLIAAMRARGTQEAKRQTDR